MSDYDDYRGKCKEFVDKAVKEDQTLTAVKGYYNCPVWGTREPHWWCKRKDGSIYDPTALQFGSKGNGVYEEFGGSYSCSECGKEVTEKDGIIMGNGNYIVCSQKCAMSLVGF